MNRLLVLMLSLLTAYTAKAQKGYDIKVNFKQEMGEGKIFLAKYYAKPPGTIYLVDSAAPAKNGSYHFTEKDSINGGLYMIVFAKNSKFIDLVMVNGAKMEIGIDTANIPSGTSFVGSDENSRHQQIQVATKVMGAKANALNTQLGNAKSRADTLKISKQLAALGDEFNAENRAYAAKYPGTLLAKMFDAVERPVPPTGKHYLADGKTVDSFYDYYYIKNHFWDKVDFADNRLINTPIYDGKLADYFNNYVIPSADSVNKEADKLLKKARLGDELFKYTLYWLADWTRTSKVMGLDASFVHLVENYYMKGDAYWLDSMTVAKYIDYAQRLKPSALGNDAPGLLLKDAFTFQPKELRDTKADYTMLVIWAPECGHCQQEIPLLDSVFNADLKQMGVEVYSVIAGKSLEEVQEAIKKYGLENWTNVIDTDGSSKFKSKYDAYSTPKMYLLDKDKKIVGKGFSHDTIIPLLEFLKRKDQKKG